MSMNLLRLLRGGRGSAPVARERLQILLATHRDVIGLPAVTYEILRRIGFEALRIVRARQDFLAHAAQCLIQARGFAPFIRRQVGVARR